MVESSRIWQIWIPARVKKVWQRVSVWGLRIRTCMVTIKLWFMRLLSCHVNCVEGYTWQWGRRKFWRVIGTRSRGQIAWSRSRATWSRPLSWGCWTTDLSFIEFLLQASCRKSAYGSRRECIITYFFFQLSHSFNGIGIGGKRQTFYRIIRALWFRGMPFESLAWSTNGRVKLTHSPQVQAHWSTIATV